MHSLGLIIGIMAAVVAVGLAVIVRTRWLQSHTLAKCVALSVGLHLLLAVVCGLLAGFVPASWGHDDKGRMTMVMVVAADDEAEDEDVDAAAPAPERMEPAVAAAPDNARHVQDVPADQASAEGVPEDVVPLLNVAAEAAAGDATPPADTPSEHPVPDSYADRSPARRAAAAVARGGSEATERAVRQALQWLAANQAQDGRWETVRHGGGRGRGHGAAHRNQATGVGSDHGVTGLAHAGLSRRWHHAHFGPAGRLRGQGAPVSHRPPAGRWIARGRGRVFCRVLLPRDGGDRGGRGCGPDRRCFAARATRAGGRLHACSAASHNRRLAVCGRGQRRHEPTRLAGDAAGRCRSGGARRRPRQWDRSVRRRAGTFLQSVSSGRSGGLAAYRAGERPTMPMTAEALFCRLMLGATADQPSVQEAVAVLAASPPDTSRPNAYAWYYATLASFHAGGPQWEAWNRRMQGAVLSLQRQDAGSLQGSWDPDPVWGGHGGRVYATAMAALTLEVYYRYVPLHGETMRVAKIR